MIDATEISFADQKLAAALPFGIVILDLNGRVRWWNEEARRLLCLNKKRDMGLTFAEFIKTPQFDQYLKPHTQTNFEINAPNCSTRTRLLLNIVDYESRYYLVSIDNITHTYLLEKIREDFVANVSHELRTPLTVIHGYLEMLLEQEASELELSSWRKIFGQMYDQSQRMQQIVEDLLMLSRLESRSLDMSERQPVAVIPLVEAICEEARTLSRERAHQINFSYSTESFIYGQEQELRSAFSNVIFNAVKYTGDEGQIDVLWRVDGRNAYLTVQDTGIGIAAEHIPRLTERFYRVDKARSRDHGGTGLGLAIVKHVLIRHDAVLEIQSQLGQGSAFSCKFSQDSLVRP